MDVKRKSRKKITERLDVTILSLKIFIDNVLQKRMGLGVTKRYGINRSLRKSELFPQ